jgi:hypothetical protein
MVFKEFWKTYLTKEEESAIQVLEQQILALDREWMRYEKENFMDWNQKLKGLKLDQIEPNMQIPMRDAMVEKKEFSVIWKKTQDLFEKVAGMIKKGNSHDAIIYLFTRIRRLEEMIDVLEIEERRTINYLQKYANIFQPFFDSNYGQGFFENQVLQNYETRFRILQMLKNEYDLIRYLLSDVI